MPPSLPACIMAVAGLYAQHFPDRRDFQQVNTRPALSEVKK